MVQIKKNNETFDIDIFGDVDKEDIEAIKNSEKEFGDLKNRVELDLQYPHTPPLFKVGPSPSSKRLFL